MTKISVRSPAKVNLFLRVLGKRPDGYHELYTLMEPVALFDEITINAEPGEGIVIKTRDSRIPTDHRNLAHKAAALFLSKTGIKRRLTIGLEKKIPVGAGLGGGSSNAATVLTSLNTLLGTGLDETELLEMAASIGSDVPFFILNSPAIARGRGEKLRRLTLPPLYFVLINPGFSVSTKWVYDNLVLTNHPEDNMLDNSERLFKTLNGLLDTLVNDLEAVTVSKYPEIRRLKGLLMRSGALASLMSGSGPTVFGLFSTRAEAERAFGALTEALAPTGEALFFAPGL